MTISVQAASAADIDAIVRLNRDVQQLHAELEPFHFKSDFDKAEVAAFFATKLALAENQFRLADSGDGPNGYVWFQVQERPETPLTLAGRRIYIHHLFVQAESRRHGVGSSLLKQVEAEALVRGIAEIALDVWAANNSARSFFEARGFMVGVPPRHGEVCSRCARSPHPPMSPAWGTKRESFAFSL